MEIAHTTIASLFAFFFVALIAGCVDAIAGGGGLIIIPTLLLAQLSPLAVLATNKMQSAAGSLTATVVMTRRKLVDPRVNIVAASCAFLGSLGGAIAVQHIPSASLDVIIPFVLLGIVVYIVAAPHAEDVERQPRMGANLYRAVIVPVIGFYDGMFGPGTGSFFSVCGVALRGQTIVTATAHAKLFNFATNLAAVLIFIVSGHVVWPIARAMMCGQILGAIIGSTVVSRGGARFIRPMILIVCVVMLGRYIVSKHAWSGLHLFAQ